MLLWCGLTTGGSFDEVSRRVATAQLVRRRLLALRPQISRNQLTCEQRLQTMLAPVCDLEAKRTVTRPRKLDCQHVPTIYAKSAARP